MINPSKKSPLQSEDLIARAKTLGACTIMLKYLRSRLSKLHAAKTPDTTEISYLRNQISLISQTRAKLERMANTVTLREASEARVWQDGAWKSLPQPQPRTSKQIAEDYYLALSSLKTRLADLAREFLSKTRIATSA